MAVSATVALMLTADPLPTPKAVMPSITHSRGHEARQAGGSHHATRGREPLGLKGVHPSAQPLADGVTACEEPGATPHFRVVLFP